MSALFQDLRPHCPPLPPGIDLRCCDVVEVMRGVRGARLIHADPPWVYSQAPGVAHPDLQYKTISMPQIVDHVSESYQCLGSDGRLLLWNTWPILGEWMEETIGRGKTWPWKRLKSGGSWHKEGGGGVGYHWLGASEPVLLYVKGAPGCQNWDALKNAHSSPREAHSEKPVEWLRGMLRRWTSPGDLVLDLYAGLAPMARACHLEGRRYIGAEIDPERHRRAVVLLAETVASGQQSLFGGAK